MYTGYYRGVVPVSGAVLFCAGPSLLGFFAMGSWVLSTSFAAYGVVILPSLGALT